MGTLFTTGSYFSLRKPQLNRIQAKSYFPDKLSEKVAVSGEETTSFGFINVGEDERAFRFVGRRTALFSGLCLVSGAILGFPGDGFAVKQGLLAGRIPGLSDPDEREDSTIHSPITLIRAAQELSVEHPEPPFRSRSPLGRETVGQPKHSLPFVHEKSNEPQLSTSALNRTPVRPSLSHSIQTPETDEPRGKALISVARPASLPAFPIRPATVAELIESQTGWRTYRRPDDKSGGHGVGWSPIIPYTFKVPDGWEEVPVSIADLGGTEIDLRFSNSQEGRLFVIVAPILRFADLDGDATIEKIGPPEKVINAFGPEVIGESVEGKVLKTEVDEHSGRKYYQFELEPPHAIISATAAGNRLYLFSVTASGLQWKRHYKDLKQIADSFRVI